MCSIILIASCDVEAWPGYLDGGQASIEYGAIQGNTYQIRVEGISSVRIIGRGCKVQFMESSGNERCVLDSGDHDFDQFHPICGNDAVTQFIILQGSKGDNVLGHIYNAMCNSYIYLSFFAILR